ncbi:MAG TPA: class I SAM-dependent methyltransferase [Longimicrobiaceae bacterium]|nr:class I SAM-dependent methyltransferase [Longimicrobiaceae bacterium]
MDEKPVYEEIADRYAASVDTKPQNAFYERPAMLSVLPPLAGARVLDVGCGSGWYAEYLVRQGAAVTAFDNAPRFVELTRARVGDRARVLQADLAQPLSFAPDDAFDLVLCPLVLHYVQDWRAVFAEFRRVLRPGGWLVFSTHHPFMDWQEFRTEDYFRAELLEDDWKIGTVSFYRRPLTAMSEDLAGAGFVIERLLEPQPTEEYRRADPEGYERLMKNPWFLVIRARREG